MVEAPCQEIHPGVRDAFQAAGQERGPEPPRRGRFHRLLEPAAEGLLQGEIQSAALKACFSGGDCGQTKFKNLLTTFSFNPTLWAPVSWAPGKRVGADQFVIYQAQGTQWQMERDYTSSPT